MVLSLNYPVLVAAIFATTRALDDGLTPSVYKQFEIDFDKSASERYSALYSYFREPLLEIEDFWWNSFYPEKVR